MARAAVVARGSRRRRRGQQEPRRRPQQHVRPQGDPAERRFFFESLKEKKKDPSRTAETISDGRLPSQAGLALGLRRRRAPKVVKNRRALGRTFGFRRAKIKDFLSLLDKGRTHARQIVDDQARVIYSLPAILPV